MLRKVSLSVLVFTYLFAGIAHFTRFEYYRKIIPTFLPYPDLLVHVSGSLFIALAVLLAISLTRKGACYGILLIWSVALPVNVYVLLQGGAGIPLPYWQLAAMIPFHLALMVWAWWHLRQEVAVGGRQSTVGRNG